MGYPESAREEGITGDVVLRVEVLENGLVGEVSILKSLQQGPGGCDEAAVEAAKEWQFIPAFLDEKPVTIWVTLPFTFNPDTSSGDDRSLGSENSTKFSKRELRELIEERRKELVEMKKNEVLWKHNPGIVD